MRPVFDEDGGASLGLLAAAEKKIYDTQKLDRSEARKTWFKCIPRFLPHRHLWYQGHNDPLGPSDRQQNNDNQLTFFPVHRHPPEIPALLKSITSRDDCERDELISLFSCFLVSLFFFQLFGFFFCLFVWLIFYSVFFLFFQTLSTPRRFV